MHPHVCQRSMPSAHGLGSLVLMVWEDEVCAAAVDVYGRTEVAMNHGTALGMPARTSFSPWTRPARLPRLCRLPQREVEGVALLVVYFHALACAELVEVASGKHAIRVVAPHGEVHVATGNRVRMALLDERGDHPLHGLDLTCGARANVGIQNAKAMHLLDELVAELLGDLCSRATLLVGTIYDLVVHVGEVLGKRNLIALVHEVAANHVKAQERAAISYVNLIVYGRTTHIHANFARLDGLKLLLAVILAVVYKHPDSYPSVSHR